MPLVKDRLWRHSDATPFTPHAEIAKTPERDLRDTAFLIARTRFLSEVDTARTGLDGGAA